MRAEYIEIRNKAYNFCKHADRDTDCSLDFNVDFNRILILESVFIILQIIEAKIVKVNFSPEMAYYMWFIKTYPELVTDKLNQLNLPVYKIPFESEKFFTDYKNIFLA